MKFNLRKYQDHAICSIENGATTIDLGMLDREEAKVLLENFKDAIDKLEWFIRVTCKEGEE